MAWHPARNDIARQRIGRRWIGFIWLEYCKDAQRNVDRKTRWIHPGTVDTSFESNGCKPLAPWLTDSYTVFLYMYEFSMKSGAPYWQSIRLLDQVQCLHYSLEANKNYLYRIRFLSNAVQCNPVACTTHRKMGVVDVKAFFSMLAKARKVSVGDARNPLDALAAQA